MTRLPHESWNVTGVVGAEYDLNDYCPVPGCPNAAEERHHIWRRSFLTGDYWWVSIEDSDEAVGNCVGLCHNHHRQITDNEATIVYEDVQFFWVHGDYRKPLDWQPPRILGSEFRPNRPVVNEDHDSELHQKNVCPTCKRKLPKEKPDTPPEERKLRKTWAVKVPLDAQENGADVLDANLEAIREELGKRGMEYGEESTQKYYVLSTAMALFLTHVKEIL